MRSLLQTIVDDGEFREFQPEHAERLLDGLQRALAAA